MIYIALMIVFSPVLLIIFYGVYKIRLAILKEKIIEDKQIPDHQKEIETISQNTDTDDEIAAVIAAAVKVYLSA